jgi:hypothetical protein
MKMKEALQNIDFSDSSLKCFRCDENDLIIYLESWDEKIIELIFSNIIKLKYQMLDFISGVYEIRDNICLNDLYDEKFGQRYNEKETYKLFHILDIEDGVIFEIVAENVTGIKKDAI